MIEVFLNIKIFKIENVLTHFLTEAKISVLCRGLQLALPPKTLEYADYTVSFELLYQDIKTTNLNTLQNNPGPLKRPT